MQLPEYHPLLLDALKNEKKTSTLADRFAAARWQLLSLYAASREDGVWRCGHPREETEASLG